MRSVTVNYLGDTVQVNYDPHLVTAEDIRAFLKKLGHEAAEDQ